MKVRYYTYIDWLDNRLWITKCWGWVTNSGVAILGPPINQRPAPVSPNQETWLERRVMTAVHNCIPVNKRKCAWTVRHQPMKPTSQRMQVYWILRTEQRSVKLVDPDSQNNQTRFQLCSLSLSRGLSGAGRSHPSILTTTFFLFLFPSFSLTHSFPTFSFCLFSFPFHSFCCCRCRRCWTFPIFPSFLSLTLVWGKKDFGGRSTVQQRSVACSCYFFHSHRPFVWQHRYHRRRLVQLYFTTVLDYW